MSVLTSVGVLLLAMLILGFMQMTPGVFALFLHYTKGKYSKNKASDLATFFVLGTEAAVMLIFLSFYFIFNSFLFTVDMLESKVFAWIIAGILVALSILFVTCYFRKGPGSTLFVSRQFISQYRQRIKTTKSRSDAFILGLTAVIPELYFTLPLYVISAVIITRFVPEGIGRAGIILLFALSAILPLIISHVRYTMGYTLADTLRFRFKNKTFFRFFIAFLYLLAAILITLGTIL